MFRGEFWKVGNPFILGSKGQRSRSRDTKTVPALDFALLHDDEDHQLPFVGDPKQTLNKSKMVDGRHFKNLIIAKFFRN